MKKDILKSEVLKFYYCRWLIGIMLGLALFIPSMALVLNEAVGEVSYDFIANQLLQSFYLSQVGFVCLGGIYFGRELVKNSMRTSLLCVPNRLGLYLTKVLNLLLWGAACLLVYTGISLITLRLGFGYEIKGSMYFSLMSLIFPVYISTLSLSLISAALVVLTSSLILPLSLMMSMILGLGQVLLQYSSKLSILPVLCVMNSFSTVSHPIYPALLPGLFIQSLWTLLFLGLSYSVFSRRAFR